MSEILVKVSEGTLRGELCLTNNDISYFSFKSIPYAKPPIEDLRFAPPQPPAPWTGVRDATKECNACAQFRDNAITGDEDCLYLNVFTPKPSPAKPFPVMVFFHGGCFVHGDGTDVKRHGPDFLVEKDVVIVNVNYRLGILGFLNLDMKEAPGNMGLKDQVQALKWVQKNIAKFGGNPKNVTIFGISAGGVSVEFLVLSPLAKGLFHKAIAQSGSSLTHWALAHNLKEVAFKMPEIKGKKITDVDALYKYLKKLPTKDLIATSLAAHEAMKTSKNMKFGFVPTIENPGDWEPFLDESPYKLLKTGSFNRVPYISGFNTREGLLMKCYGRQEFDQLGETKDMINYLPFDIDEVDKTEIATKLKAIYLNSKEYDANDFAIDFFTDADFLGAIYVSASLLVKRVPVFFYEFSYDGRLNFVKKEKNVEDKGACHGDDTGYLIACELLASEKLTKTDELVRDRMVLMWTNFAKYGDPTPSKTDKLPIKWEPTSGTEWRYLEISDQLNMREQLHPQRMKLYVDLFEKYYNSDFSKKS